MNRKDIENKKFTEEELDALYYFLDLNLDSMNEEEKQMWLEVLKKLDSNFDED